MRTISTVEKLKNMTAEELIEHITIDDFSTKIEIALYNKLKEVITPNPEEWYDVNFVNRPDATIRVLSVSHKLAAVRCAEWYKGKSIIISVKDKVGVLKKFKVTGRSVQIYSAEEII